MKRGGRGGRRRKPGSEIITPIPTQLSLHRLVVRWIGMIEDGCVCMCVSRKAEEDRRLAVIEAERQRKLEEERQKVSADWHTRVLHGCLERECVCMNHGCNALK